MSGKIFGDAKDRSGSRDKEDGKAIEKEEEAKLKAKYPSVARPGPGFLQKRLQKGQKFFDSGDYNMAKAATGKGRLPVSTLSKPAQAAAAAAEVEMPSADTVQPTGDLIPSPELVMTATRKSSIHIPSKLASGGP